MTIGPTYLKFHRKGGLLRLHKKCLIESNLFYEEGARTKGIVNMRIALVLIFLAVVCYSLVLAADSSYLPASNRGDGLLIPSMSLDGNSGNGNSGSWSFGNSSTTRESSRNSVDRAKTPIAKAPVDENPQEGNVAPQQAEKSDDMPPLAESLIVLGGLSGLGVVLAGLSVVGRLRRARRIHAEQQANLLEYRRPNRSSTAKPLSAILVQTQQSADKSSGVATIELSKKRRAA